MPNISVTQDNATLSFDRLLQPDRKAAVLEDIFYFFARNKPYVRQDGGYTGAGVRMLTQWLLSGANLSEQGRNVDADGRLWVMIEDNGGGTWNIRLFKDAAGANEVARATGQAPNSTVSLVDYNNSGLSGTVRLGPTVVAVGVGTYAIQVFLGFAEYDRQVYSGEQEDGATLAEQAALNRAIATSLLGLIGRCNRSIETSRGLLPQLTRIWQIDSQILFVDKQTRNDNNTITVLMDGILERLRQNWRDNTGGGGIQSIAASAFAAAGGAVAASGNVGASVWTIGAIGENLVPGVLQAVCVEDTLPFQRFRVSFAPADGSAPIVGRNLLTIGFGWDDPDIPIAISTVPGYTKSGADSKIAAVSEITGISGLTSDNSDNGKLYGKTVASGAAFLFKFYADSALTRLVAQSPVVAAGAAFQATSQ
ncbi:MAG TPA: hypothetical protein VHF22_04645, partial [Planctomycetota bacterium]|nr:hypothetical protein [Planctomycetota bacterium]